VPSANFSGVEHLMKEKNGLAAGYDEFKQKVRFQSSVADKPLFNEEYFKPNSIKEKIKTVSCDKQKVIRLSLYKLFGINVNINLYLGRRNSSSVNKLKWV
jgi:hypothetical protein